MQSLKYKTVDTVLVLHFHMPVPATTMCILTLRGGLAFVRVPLVVGCGGGLLVARVWAVGVTVGWGVLLGAQGLEASSPNSLQCQCPLTQLPPSDPPQSCMTQPGSAGSIQNICGEAGQVVSRL